MKRNNKIYGGKGQSQLIAVVILIAMVMMISISIITFTKTTVTEQSKISETELRSIQLINIGIKKAIATNKNVSLLIENKDRQNISELIIGIKTTNNITIFRSPGVEPYSARWIESNVHLEENVTSVELIPVTIKNNVKYTHEVSRQITTSIENYILPLIDSDKDKCNDDIDYNSNEYCPRSTCSLDLGMGCSGICQLIYCNENEICDSGACKLKLVPEIKNISEEFIPIPYKGKVINEVTEEFNNEQGTSLTIYSAKHFHKFGNQWYDLEGLANISSINDNFIIHIANNSIRLRSYIITDNNKKYLDSLDQNERSNVKNKNIIRKLNKSIEFGNEINNYNIDKFGYDIENLNKLDLKILNNKIIVDNGVEIDFNDLNAKGYIVNLSSNRVNVENLKPGVNSIDPILQFYSTSKDGEVWRAIRRSYTGVNSFSQFGIAGYVGTISPGTENRVFFNFNTSVLGTRPKIKSVNLTLYVPFVVNGDESENPCHIGDWNYALMNGTFIGPTLDKSDYGKGSFNQIVTLGQSKRYVINLSDVGVINKTGETDFALKPLFGHTSSCDEYNAIDLSESPGTSFDPYLNITFYNACIGTNPPINNGDWVIKDSTYCENLLITMNGNVSIKDTGSLILKNVTLLFNETLQTYIYGIEIAGNGSLQISDLDNNMNTMYDASNISVLNIANINNRTFLKIYPNAKFKIENSIVGGLAYAFQAYSPSVIKNNIIEFTQGIVLYSPANGTIITGNIFKVMYPYNSIINLRTNSTISGSISNITIEKNNITVQDISVDLTSNKNDKIKFMHNKQYFFGGITSDFLRINKNVTNIFVYNNSFIDLSGSPIRHSGLIQFSSSTGINPTLNKPNWTFVDNVIHTTGDRSEVRFIQDNNVSVVFLNNTFNYSKISFDRMISGGLEVQWYVDINVTYDNESVAPNSNVTLRNATNDFFTSVLIPLNGIIRLNVTELFINGANYYSLYNNYTITVNSSDPGFDNFTGQLNITKLSPEDAITPMLVYNVTLKKSRLGNEYPDITKVEVTDDGILKDCSSPQGCYLNPVIHYNVTDLNVSISTIDPDGNCDLSTHNGIIYFCLLDYSDITSCNSNNANYTFNLDRIIINSTLPGMKECNFTFSNSKGPEGTMPFYIKPGDYKFMANISESNVSLQVDPEREGKWKYNLLSALGFVNSTGNDMDTITLGSSNNKINRWNYGTERYNITNWGNLPFKLTWNISNPTDIDDLSQIWDIALYPNRIQIDDDNETDFIDNSLQPLNLTYAQESFGFASGVLTCHSYSCNNSNATLPLYFHINPPLGLKPGIYNSIITYEINPI